MKILVVDDDITSRMLLNNILQKWGYETVQAKDGNEAWKIVSETREPEILIVDWMMPELTGPELCQKISTELDRSKFYIILLTARGKKEDLVEGLNSGADDFIPKPWNNEELKARIKVGQRILELQELAARKEKLKGILEMAGAVCHELNQPLQVAMGYADMLLMDISENDPNRKSLEQIVKSVERMGELTRKIMNVTDYSKISYIEGYKNLIDIHKSSKD